MGVGHLPIPPPVPYAARLAWADMRSVFLFATRTIPTPYAPGLAGCNIPALPAGFFWTAAYLFSSIYLTHLPGWVHSLYGHFLYTVRLYLLVLSV